MTTFVFHWGAPENDIYSAFASLCYVVVFFAIFPALQALYKKFVSTSQPSDVEADRSLLLDTDESQDPSPNNSESNVSSISAIKMDFAFIIGGLCLLILAHILVPLIATVPALFLCKYQRCWW